MIDELLRLCNFPIGNRKTLSMRRDFPKLLAMKENNILIPLQSSLTVNLPPVLSMNHRDKWHNLFDPLSPTFTGKLYLQLNGTTLTDSIQSSTTKSKLCIRWPSHGKSPLTVPMALNICSLPNRRMIYGKMHASWISMGSSINSSRLIQNLGEGNFMSLNEIMWYWADSSFFLKISGRTAWWR
jgi:hypothetical protein